MLGTFDSTGDFGYADASLDFRMVLRCGLTHTPLNILRVRGLPNRVAHWVGKSNICFSGRVVRRTLTSQPDPQVLVGCLLG